MKNLIERRGPFGLAASSRAILGDKQRQRREGRSTLLIDEIHSFQKYRSSRRISHVFARTRDGHGETGNWLRGPSASSDEGQQVGERVLEPNQTLPLFPIWHATSPESISDSEEVE